MERKERLENERGVLSPEGDQARIPVVLHCNKIDVHGQRNSWAAAETTLCSVPKYTHARTHARAQIPLHLVAQYDRQSHQSGVE